MNKFAYPLTLQRLLKSVGTFSFLFPSGRFLSASLLCTSIVLSSCKTESTRTYVLKTEKVKVDSLSQIVMLQDTLVKPVLYTNVTGLERLPPNKAKAKFVAMILPSILVAKHHVNEKRHKIRALKEKKVWTSEDSTLFFTTKKKYKATSHDDLIGRMGTLPNSIVLAQAAVESGWGQSRFFRQGNNVFGMWSYSAKEPRMRAGIPRNGKYSYLRAYGDVSESIVDYFETLGSAKSYKSLRTAREKTQSPLELLPHLKYYSEKRLTYTNELRKMIILNDFTQFDKYTIDPQYMVAQ